MITKIIVIFVCLSSFAFACGGCVDSSLGGIKASEAIKKYLTQEIEIATTIKKINNVIKEQILKTEKEIVLINKILIELNKEKAIGSKKMNFLLKQQNEVQSTTNNIKAL